jgi:hypothetical protein
VHQDADGNLEDLVSSLVEVPAVARNRYLDVLAANPLARRLSAAFEPGGNLARFTFFNPIVPGSTGDWAQVARQVASSLRDSLQANLEDAGFRSLVGELATRSEAFNRAWAAEPPGRGGAGQIDLEHPFVGHLALAYQDLLVHGVEPGVVLTVWRARDAASGRRLRELGELP